MPRTPRTVARPANVALAALLLLGGAFGAPAAAQETVTCEEGQPCGGDCRPGEPCTFTNCEPSDADCPPPGCQPGQANCSFRGPAGIPGLVVDLDPALLVLAPGQNGTITATLRNEGNRTLNLSAELSVHEPAQTGSGPGGGMVVRGGGPGSGSSGPALTGGGDRNFTATLSSRGVRLPPNGTASLTLTIHASATAANGTRKMAALVLTDADARTAGGPPPVQLAEAILRIPGSAPRPSPAPGAAPTLPPGDADVRSEDAANATPGAGPALALLGIAVAAAALARSHPEPPSRTARAARRRRKP